MITPEQIDYIEFNLTNRCNAGCPVCVRTQMGDRLDLNSITPELFETIAQGLGEHAKSICASFCGTTGDAMSHPQIGEIIDIAIKHYRDVFIETNGGTRSQEWWRELGSRKRLKVQFSVDGLEDTNGLYRINTEFKRIMSNAKAFIDAGGRANWKYIIFDHNQHQVEQARELARDMGFQKFTTVVTNRFFRPDMVYDVESKSYRAKVNNVDEQIKQEGFTIKPATGSDPSRMKQQGKTWRELDPEQDVSIDCRTKKEGYLFVDQWGNLWPCCFWAVQHERQAEYLRWSHWWDKFEDMCGKRFNQLSKDNTVVDLLKNDLFTKWLPDSFNGKHDKCTVCLAMCTANKTLTNKQSRENL